MFDACDVDTMPLIVFHHPPNSKVAADWFTRAGQAKVAQSFGTLRKWEFLAGFWFLFRGKSMDMVGLRVTTPLCWLLSE